MPNVSEYNYKYWGWLKERGWEIVPSPRKLGTAAVDAANKKILVSPRVFRRPNTRVVRYVMPHEIWHALHAEIMEYACDELRYNRKLTWKSAVEVVAETGCLTLEKSKMMERWVRASVLWHSRVGYRYNMADVNSVESKRVVESIVKAVEG